MGPKSTPTKFTDFKVCKLKPRSELFEVWEARGLGLRVFPSGWKTWVFLYRYKGRSRRMTIGHYPEVSVAKAHKRHGEALVDLENGIDPGAVAVAAKREERQAEIVSDLVADYIRLYAAPRKRSWKEDERMLAREVLPRWGRRKAKDITRRDVVSLLDAIVARGAPITANRVLACVRKMFAWAIGRDILTTSPCIYVPRPAPERARDRVLSEAELKKLLGAIKASPPDDRVALAVSAILTTAQRPGEVLEARREEIDLDSLQWTIPAERAKNGLSHRVPVAPRFQLILKAARALAPGSPYVFPSHVTKRPYQRNYLSRWIGAFREAHEVEKFTAHDLRRTAATWMTGIGIPRLVVGRILNHSETDVTRVYDRSEYDREKREALERWNAKLEEVETGHGDRGKA